MIATTSSSISALSSSSSSSSSSKVQWTKLDPLSQNIIPKRSGHTGFVWNGTPYIFGGYAEDDIDEPSSKTNISKNRYVVNDLWKWNNDMKQYEHVETTGDIPGPRLVAAMACSDDKAYLFGGWDPSDGGSIILDTVHELDLIKQHWKKLDNVHIPDGPTSRHIAIGLNDNRILLHNHRCIDYVLIFDPETKSFQKQTTTGICPSSRGLHATCYIDDTTICIFGGAAQDQTMSNQLFFLNTNTWKWTEITSTTSNCPSPRAAPCIVKGNDNELFVFGGAEATDVGLNPCNDLWSFDIRTKEWMPIITTTTNPPPARNAATLLPINNNEFILTGGWVPFRETYNDCYIFSTFSS